MRKQAHGPARRVSTGDGNYQEGASKEAELILSLKVLTSGVMENLYVTFESSRNAFESYGLQMLCSVSLRVEVIAT